MAVAVLLALPQIWTPPNPPGRKPLPRYNGHAKLTTWGRLRDRDFYLFKANKPQ